MNRTLTYLPVLLLLSLMNPAEAGYKQEYKLDITSSLDTSWGKGAVRFTSLVRQRTDGRINIVAYNDPQLSEGGQTNSFMLIYNGTADFANQSSINWSNQIKELNLWAIPFLVSQFPDRYAAEDAIINGKTGRMVAAALEKLGVHLLAYGENGFRELTTDNREIHSPEDLEGLKIRVVGCPIYMDTYNTLGSTAVMMDWSQTMNAIQQGIVNGQENPAATFCRIKISDYHKYMLDWHITIDPTLFAVNARTWKTFTAKDRDIIVQCAKDAARYQIALSRIGFDDGFSAKYLKSIGEEAEIIDRYMYLIDRGIKVTKLTEAQTKVFFDKCDPVRRKWREKIGPKLVDTALAEMAATQKK